MKVLHVDNLGWYKSVEVRSAYYRKYIQIVVLVKSKICVESSHIHVFVLD